MGSRQIRNLASVALVVLVPALAGGCSEEARRQTPEAEKSWTLGAQSRRAERLRDSALDDLSPRAISEAKRRGAFIDTAEEVTGILEVRTGPFFPKLTETDRRGLATAFIHQMRRDAGMVVFVDGETGRPISAYNEDGPVQQPK